MPASVAEFVKAAEDSGILSTDSLAGYVQGVALETDATPLANCLVKDGRLTAFQAKYIYGGKAESLVLGPYVILDLLGKGGMGYVYKAEHRKMRRIVALKVIARTALKSPAAIRRFEREVQAAARLEHPNIVTAFDAGEAAGTHYLVMQFVEGRTLSDLVKEGGPQPVDRAVDWVLQAARGLAFAHQQGIVHRDIKPGNLLVDSRGTVKILDMGLAGLEIEADEDPLTNPGQIMGTVDYMAPEQGMDARRADARSDIYSLGVTLWYLLAGRSLFSGDTVMSRMMAHMQTPAPPLTSAHGDALPEIDAVFQRMVAKKPADRFQSMQEVIAAMQSLSPGGATPGTGNARTGDAPVAAVSAAARSAPPPPPAVAPFGAAQARRHQEAWARHIGIETVTTNSIGAALVVIPPGRFTMGEGEATIDVTLTRPFVLGQTAVTQGQWRELMQTEPWKGMPYTTEGVDVAATYISWDEAAEFCARLTALERHHGTIGPAQRYRLPTEAEWEFACRAGTVTAYSFGDDETLLGDYAWFGGGWTDGSTPEGNAASEPYAHTVRLKRPNQFGLFDIHGNVSDWVADWQDDYATSPLADPQGPAAGVYRVRRGGSWITPAALCRAAIRTWSVPTFRCSAAGFRLALSPDGIDPSDAAASS